MRLSHWWTTPAQGFPRPHLRVKKFFQNTPRSHCSATDRGFQQSCLDSFISEASVLSSDLRVKEPAFRGPLPQGTQVLYLINAKLPSPLVLLCGQHFREHFYYGVPVIIPSIKIKKEAGKMKHTFWEILLVLSVYAYCGFSLWIKHDVLEAST